jgi:hypothetical protein
MTASSGSSAQEDSMMRGDWKDQYLDEQYRMNIMRQLEQERVVGTIQPGIERQQFPVLQVWLYGLLSSRPLDNGESAPVLKTRNL